MLGCGRHKITVGRFRWTEISDEALGRSPLASPQCEEGPRPGMPVLLVDRGKAKAQIAMCSRPSPLVAERC